MKEFFKQFKSLLKMAVPSLLMYVSAGGILIMLTLKDELAWDNQKLTWTLVCGLAAIGYNVLVSLMHGTDGYDMLVTGNVQRRSLDIVEGGYKMSKYRPEKEYRVWKGFVSACFIGVLTLLAGVLMGVNQASIDAMALTGKSSFFVVLCGLLSGWCVLPLYYLNVSGAGISYFWVLAFALIPIVVTGVCYIVGAYRKRGKELKKQAIADKMEQDRLAREQQKKINYGALPGTKPRKRK